MFRISLIMGMRASMVTVWVIGNRGNLMLQPVLLVMDSSDGNAGPASKPGTHNEEDQF